MTKLTQIEEARRRKARTQELCDGLKLGMDVSEQGQSGRFRPGRIVKKDPKEVARVLDPKLD